MLAIANRNRKTIFRSEKTRIPIGINTKTASMAVCFTWRNGQTEERKQNTKQKKTQTRIHKNKATVTQTKGKEETKTIYYGGRRMGRLSLKRTSATFRKSKIW